MCLDCKGADRQDMGSGAQTCLRYERQQSSRLREHANDQDIRSNRSSSTASGYDYQTLDQAEDSERCRKVHPHDLGFQFSNIK